MIASVAPSREMNSGGAASAKVSLPAIPVVFHECELGIFIGSKVVGRQFLAQQYPADDESYPAMSYEEGATVNVFARDLDGEVDWNWRI